MESLSVVLYQSCLTVAVLNYKNVTFNGCLESNGMTWGGKNMILDIRFYITAHETNCPESLPVGTDLRT